MVNPVPRTLAGRYEVGELIGRGGMAEVHIGHDNRLGRTVAIKILRSDLARDPSFQARFRREAQAAASLNHPSIVAVYDTGEDTSVDPATGAESHIPFIVMEYVEGHTVRDILRDGNAVPIEEAIEITAGVLSALEYSHHAGIVHRDIKPANVMLTPTGAVKVMDFGIARAVADSAATMTQTHSVIGTAQYLSPEQARGESVDTRSDLYSTGCLLYELLTGRPPFTGDSPVAVAYQHVRELAIPPSTVAPDVPRVLDQITLKALAKDRNERYSSASEFRAALEAAARGEAPEATSVYPPIPQPAPADPYATAVMTPAGTPAQATQAIPTFPAGTEQTSTLPWQQPTEDSLFEVDNEEDENSSKKRLIWTLVSVGVVAILAIVAIMLINGSKEKEPATFAVPSFAGMTRPEAEAHLKSLGFVGKANVSQIKNDSVEEGLFVESDPGEGEQLALDGVIDLVFSSGPNATTVPDVAGRTQEEAEQMLEAAGLKFTYGPQEHSATVEKDNIVRSDPKSGMPVAVGATVKLYVSDGFMEVVDFTGKSKDEAFEGLKKLGFVPKAEEQPDDRVNDGELEEGQVLKQDPSSGALEVGSTVTVYVATAVEFEKKKVPDVVGKTWDEGAALIYAEGLQPKRMDVNNDSVPAGVIIRSFPSAGREMPVDETVVEVEVSLGPAQQQPDPGQQPDPSQSGGGNGNGNGSGNGGAGEGQGPDQGDD